MNTILLVLSTTRQSSRAIEFALKKAGEEQAKLLLLFIVDVTLPRQILDKMMDGGFMGSSPSEDTYQVVLREYRRRGETMLQEVSRQAEMQHIGYETIIMEGEYVEACLKIIHKRQPALTILTHAERSNLSRLLFGSAVATIKKQSPYPVDIIDDGR